jgi:tetratricopeptide (TPR) repeat protein
MAAPDQPSTAANALGPTLPSSSATEVFDSAIAGAFGSGTTVAAEARRSTRRYRLEVELGRGGMGVVYRALDMPMQRRLAIKVMLASAQASALERRFLEEARITGQLQHPGIAPVHEIGRLDDGRVFFSMKLIEGRTLAGLLKARSSPAEDLPRFLGIFGQLCQTLAFVHSRGMIHRDLKPSNIMVGAFGEAQVMDWGLAKQLSIVGCRSTIESDRQSTSDKQPSEKTKIGAILGTPAFMAPEQARGEIDRLDQRCDVFGLGAILSVILTGEPPYRGPDASAVVTQAAAGDVRDCFARLDACGADAKLIALAKRCLAPAVADRLPDAGAVADAVECYQTGIQERLRRAEVERARAEVKSAEERKRRKLTLGLAAAVLGLLLLVGVAAWWLDGQRRERQRQTEQARKDILEALAQVESLRDQSRWKDARGALELARKRLTEDASDDLRQQVKDAGDLLDLVVDLDRVRQDKALFVEGKLNSAGAPAGYRDAFLAHQFDILQGDEADLVKRLSSSPAREALVTALDDWAGVEKERAAIQKRLGRLARAADPDEWRAQLREPAIWKDVEKLKQFAARVDTTRLTAALAERLGKELESEGGNGIALLEKMWAQRKTDFWFSFILGNTLKTRRIDDKALGFYRTALAARPDSSAAWYNYGMLLHRLRDLDGAAAAYRKVLALNPRHDLALANLSAILIEQGQLDAALETARKALALRPKNTIAACNAGCVLERRKDYVEAEKVLRQAIEGDEKFARAYTFLGVVREKRGDHDEALKLHRQAVALDPELALARTNLGFGLHHKGFDREALANFRIAVELDPGDVQAWIGQGNCLYRMGDIDGAVSAYRGATIAAPNNSSAHYNHSVTLAARRDFVASLAACRRAIELDRNETKIWSQFGYVLEQTGKYEEALDAYRKAIAVNEQYAPAHLNLAGFLFNRQRFEEAVSPCRKAIDLDPKLGQAYILLGKTLTAQEKFAEAVEVMQQALKAPIQQSLRTDAAKVGGYADRMRRSAENLPAILRGELIAKGVDANLNLAHYCMKFRQLPLAASRFYQAAFTEKPDLLDNSLRAGYRFHAARAALQGAAGIGDAAFADDAERARQRHLALGWLRDDLTAWSKLASDKPADRPLIRQMLQRLPVEADFALVRDAKSLAKLPAQEQADWRKLWADVRTLLDNIGTR